MSDLRNFDLNLLVALKLLLQEGSVSRAAEKMFVSPSAMSHILQRLRQQLNDPILIRSSKGMEPTAKALSMLGPIAKILQDVESLIDVQSHFDAGTSEKRFVIATNDYVDFVILPHLVESVQNRAPNLQIHVKPTRTTVPYASIDKGQLDLVIGFREILVPPAHFRQTSLVADSLMCLARRDHPATDGDIISLEKYLLCKHIVMSGHDSGSGPIDKCIELLGEKRNIALIAPNFLSVPNILATTDLVFSVPSVLARHFCHIAPLKAMPLPVNCPELDLVMVWHPQQENDPAHVWLRQQIIENSDISALERRIKEPSF